MTQSAFPLFKNRILHCVLNVGLLSFVCQTPLVSAQTAQALKGAQTKSVSTLSKSMQAPPPDLPKYWNQTNWCAQLEMRLMRLPKGQCEASELIPTGARSVRGVPIWQREVPAQGSSNFAANSDIPSFVTAAAGKKILVIGGIHGDELTSTEIVFRWMDRLNEPAAKLQHWKFIPLLNPDGFLSKPATRTNARGVDLNRNFPTPNWHAKSKRYWEVTTGKDPRRYPGPAPLSEPESAWLNRQLNSFKPDVIISVHAPLGVLDFDGPPPAPARIGHLYLNQIGVFPGSLGNYFGNVHNIPVVTIELPNAVTMPEPMEQDLMWRDILLWLAQNPNAPEAKQSNTPDVPSVMGVQPKH